MRTHSNPGTDNQTLRDTSSIQISDIDSIESSQVTSQEYLMNLLHQMDKSSVLPINAYKEIVRYLISQFNGLNYLNDEMEAVEVKCRYGNPERTVAKLKSHDNMIIPIITVSQNSILEDDNRRRFANVIMQKTYYNKETLRGERVISLCDRPVTAQYNVNLWCKYMDDMDQLAQQIRLKFNPSLELSTEFSKDSKAFLVSETNNYSFSVGDKEDRIIRKTFTVGVETYIKSPKFKITSTGKLEQINLESYLT